MKTINNNAKKNVKVNDEHGGRNCEGTKVANDILVVIIVEDATAIRRDFATLTSTMGVVGATLFVGGALTWDFLLTEKLALRCFMNVWCSITSLCMALFFDKICCFRHSIPLLGCKFRYLCV